MVSINHPYLFIDVLERYDSYDANGGEYSFLQFGVGGSAACIRGEAGRG